MSNATPPFIVHDKNGTIRHYSDAAHTILHREGGPAVTSPTSNEHEWRVNGKRHRIGGPALMSHLHRTLEWWENGELHRVDGPAVESWTSQEWYVNGECHRVDGPAFIRLSYPTRINDFSATLSLTSKDTTWYLFGQESTRQKAKKFLEETCRQLEEKDINNISFSILKEIYKNTQEGIS